MVEATVVPSRLWSTAVALPPALVAYVGRAPTTELLLTLPTDPRPLLHPRNAFRSTTGVTALFLFVGGRGGALPLCSSTPSLTEGQEAVGVEGSCQLRVLQHGLLSANVTVAFDATAFQRIGGDGEVEGRCQRNVTAIVD